MLHGLFIEFIPNQIFTISVSFFLGHPVYWDNKQQRWTYVNVPPS